MNNQRFGVLFHLVVEMFFHATVFRTTLDSIWPFIQCILLGRFPSGEGQPSGEGDCSAPSNDVLSG